MAEPNRHRLNVLLFYGFVLIIAILAFRILKPFLMTLAWAAILAMSASPIYNRLLRRRKPARAALLATLATFLLLVVPSILLLVALGREAKHAFDALPSALEEARNHPRLWEAVEWVRARVPLPAAADLKPRLAAGAEQAGKFIAASVGSILQNVAMFLFHLVIALIAMFFLLRDSRPLGAFCRKLLPFDDKRTEELVSQSRELVFAGTLVTLGIAALQGLVGGVVFALLGLDAPVLWGAVMGAFALFPFLGTFVVWGPAALWLIATGSWGRGIALLAVGTLLVGTIDNVLRPALMSGKSQMNGLIALLSLLGGLMAFGFAGLVLGPVVAAVVITLFHVAVADDGDR